jgi:hypothetical protein
VRAPDRANGALRVSSTLGHEKETMGTLDTDIRELQKCLGEGAIQRAYRGIISYMSRLRTVFANQQGGSAVSGLYQGYFDMTYFALFPKELKKRNLKLAIVFNYQTFQFEVWLSAQNRQVQRHYWRLLLNTGYKKYPLVEPTVGVDAILQVTLVADYSLEAESKLTANIIEGVTAFEHDILAFLDDVDA